MIKLIVFDLDGVLIDSKKIHNQAFQQALTEFQPYLLSESEQLSSGQIVNQLDADLGHQIRIRKHELTHELILKNYQPNAKIIDYLIQLKKRNYLIYVASNSDKKTVLLTLMQCRFFPYIDKVFTNEDVKHPKPYPEIYWKCCTEAKVLPNETLILEDSEIGRKAAYDSGAHVLPIDDPDKWDLNDILRTINYYQDLKKTICPQIKINVVIPMAGWGKRFSEAGFKDPKPLIKILDKRMMIDLVLENLGLVRPSSKIIFIVMKEHYYHYNLEEVLKFLDPRCEIIIEKDEPRGQATTVLEAKHLIDNDLPLIIANCDQYLEWDVDEFLDQMENSEIDGGIVIQKCKDRNPKWSYVKLDPKTRCISETAEKKAISDNITVGVYYWKKGSDFIKYTEQMVNKKLKVNNEYYVCPVYNEAISGGLRFTIYPCDKMWDLGNPADLQTFIDNHPKL